MALGGATEQAAANIMATTPENQAATFRNQHQVWPHRIMRCGSVVRPLPLHARSLGDRTFAVGGADVAVADFMARRRTAGFLVLKDGEVALERYGLGCTPQSRWTSFSTAKSITATLVGAALHDGAIGSLDDPCDRYLPQLRGSAYDGVTIRNALRMSSGVRWNEGDQSDGDDARRLGRAMVSRRPGAILEFLSSLPRVAPEGSRFNYSTGESCLLGAVVASATGRWLADYGGEKIWGPAGMEADAYWQLESEDGLELGGLGVSLCLRDAGRFGLLAMEDGVTFSGQRVLPTGWRELAGQPDSPATDFGRLTPGSPAGYGYHWWALPGAPFADGLHAGAFLALGAFGQRIYVNPAERVVVVIQSAWRQPSDPEAEAETVAVLRTMIGALRPPAEVG